jgi:hypothetical protein
VFTGSIEVHESAHATVARLLGVSVVAISVADEQPFCRTRTRCSNIPADEVERLKRLAIVDLAAGILDDETACLLDLAAAADRCQQIIRLRHRADPDAQLTRTQCIEAENLLAELRERARLLVENHLGAIARLAAELKKEANR